MFTPVFAPTLFIFAPYIYAFCLRRCTRTHTQSHAFCRTRANTCPDTVGLSICIRRLATPTRLLRLISLTWAPSHLSHLGSISSLSPGLHLIYLTWAPSHLSHLGSISSISSGLHLISLTWASSYLNQLGSILSLTYLISLTWAPSYLSHLGSILSLSPGLHSFHLSPLLHLISLTWTW